MKTGQCKTYRTLGMPPNRTQNMRFYSYVSNGKEKDAETGYGYSGARYMDHELMTMWLSVDPMADKYPSISPYAYCTWNPVKLVDPDGCMIDDYFSYEGTYLGSDDAETKNVRIISEFSWNSLIQDENGNVEHDLANQMSTSFSEASANGMSEKAQLSVYQHYNFTGKQVHAIPNEKTDSKKLGMQTAVGLKNEKTTIQLNVRLHGNVNTKACDNANNILNLFAHENNHINKAKDVGYYRYAELKQNDLKSLELNAVSAQKEHISWSGTSDKFKMWTEKYLNSFK